MRPQRTSARAPRPKALSGCRALENGVLFSAGQHGRQSHLSDLARGWLVGFLDSVRGVVGEWADRPLTQALAALRTSSEGEVQIRVAGKNWDGPPASWEFLST